MLEGNVKATEQYISNELIELNKRPVKVKATKDFNNLTEVVKDIQVKKQSRILQWFPDSKTVIGEKGNFELFAMGLDEPGDMIKINIPDLKQANDWLMKAENKTWNYFANILNTAGKGVKKAGESLANLLPPEVDIDTRDPRKDRETAERLQEKERQFRKIDKEIKPNEVSPKLPTDTTVPDGVPSLDITPDVSPIETFSKDFIGKTDTRKGLKKVESKEPLMKRIAKILRKWKPVSEVNAKELEKTFDKKDHDLVKVLAAFESFSEIAEDVGDGEVTIGYGMTKTGAKLGDKITSEKAAKMFKKRLYKTEIPKFNKYIKPFLKKQLTPIQRIVVISLIYNLGLDGFRYNKKGKETNAFKALKKGDYEIFKYQAFDSTIGFVKSEGVINDGLVNRRAAEEEMWDK